MQRLNMLASFLLTYVALFLPVLAIPAHTARATSPDSIVVPRLNPLRILCAFIPLPLKLCPVQGSRIDRITPLGTAPGVSDPLGALRFAVRYGKAPRWQPSSVVTAWELPYVLFRPPNFIYSILFI